MASSSPASEILIVAARALAHADGRDARLAAILRSLAEQVEAESAVIFVAGPEGDPFEPAASVGLSDATLSGLATAVRNPAHPIARTAVDRMATFDVPPTAAGGPALRSHVPLVIRRGGEDVLVGVLAIAHEQPIDAALQPLVLAAADLAGVAIEYGPI